MISGVSLEQEYYNFEPDFSERELLSISGRTAASNSLWEFKSLPDRLIFCFNKYVIDKINNYPTSPDFNLFMLQM